MFKVLLLCIVFMTSSLFAQSASVLDDKVQLKDEEFIQSIVQADTIVLGKYVQGGKTKAKVSVDKVLVGDASGDIEIAGIDNEKIRLRYRREAYKAGDAYIFILKKGAKNFSFVPAGISIPVSRDNLANFSFNTPHMINFWQPFDENLVEIAIKAIREKADKMQNESTKEAFAKLVAGYIEKKDNNSLKAALAVAKLGGLTFDEETYNSFVDNTNSLACLAVKFSGDIMGDLYFNQNILPKVEKFNADNQTAFGYAAMALYSKQSVAVMGKILNKAELYSPSSSECFPYPKPATNKEVFVRALIEIDAPETMRMISAQVDTGDAEWLGKVLAIISEYDGADLVELVLKADANERQSERKIEFNNYFDRVKSKETAEILVGLFNKSNDDYWKRKILGVVGKYQYPESLNFLVSVLNENPKEEIREEAAIAIGQLGVAGGAKPLYEFIVREKSILAKSIGIKSIAKITDKSVQEYLKKLVSEESDPKVREEAANAIEENIFNRDYGWEKE